MGKRKSQKKRKPQYSITLSTEEEGLLRSLIENRNGFAPSRIVEELPSPTFAQAMVERLPVDHPEGPDLILAIGDAFGEKPLKKAAKKWFFRRRQKGLPLPDLITPGFKTPGETVLPMKQPLESAAEAFLGPIDGLGSRAVFITIPQMPKGVDVGLGILNDHEGILEFIFGRYSKKRMREVKAFFFEKVGVMVETSLSHACAILENAYAQKEADADAAASGYRQLRPWLLENAPPLPGPAIYEHMDTGGISGDILTHSQIKRLLDHPHLRSWIIEPDHIQPILEEIKNAEESPILVSGEQRRSRIQEIRESAVSKIYSDSERRRLRARLEEMAYIFLKTGEEEFARLSLAAARSLDEKDSILGVNPFLLVLVEHSLGFHAGAADRTGKADPEGAAATGSIIVP